MLNSKTVVAFPITVLNVSCRVKYLEISCCLKTVAPHGYHLSSLIFFLFSERILAQESKRIVIALSCLIVVVMKSNSMLTNSLNNRVSCFVRATSCNRFYSDRGLICVLDGLKSGVTISAKAISREENVLIFKVDVETDLRPRSLIIGEPLPPLFRILPISSDGVEGIGYVGLSLYINQVLALC